MNQASYKIATMCRVLGVSTSGYYGWRGRQPASVLSKTPLCWLGSEPFMSVLAAPTGCPRIHAQLSAQGTHVGRKRIARLMHKAGFARSEPSQEIADDDPQYKGSASC